MHSNPDTLEPNAKKSQTNETRKQRSIYSRLGASGSLFITNYETFQRHLNQNMIISEDSFQRPPERKVYFFNGTLYVEVNNKISIYNFK